MSNSTKVTLLVLGSLVCLSILGLGLYLRQDMLIILGDLLVSALVVVGIVVFFTRVLPKLGTRTIIIIFGSVYLILVVLVFIAPELVALIGTLATVAPIVIYLAVLRARDVELGQGCGSVLLVTVGGLVLLGLLWLFQRESFGLVLDLLGLGT